MFYIRFRTIGKCVILLIGLVFGYHQAGRCSNYSGVAALPESNPYRQSSIRSLKVLTALLYEDRRLFDQANQIWKSFPDYDPQVSSHLLHFDLASWQEIKPSGIPKSDQSLLAISRYLGWMKEWEKALCLLNDPGVSSLSMDNRLESVRYNILLGQYKEAEELIGRLAISSHRDAMQVEIYKTWLLVLAGNREKALSAIANLEENYLYLPLSTMFPLGYLGDDDNQESVLQKSLIRFPSNKTVFEQSIHHLVKAERWQDLDALVQSQQFLESGSVNWFVLAETYLNTGTSQQFDHLLKSLLSRESKQPEYYDLIARAAIKRKNWELLKRVSVAYQTEFPELMDGKLYQALYYQKTGQIDRSHELLKQIGL